MSAFSSPSPATGPRSQTKAHPHTYLHDGHRNDAEASETFHQLLKTDPWNVQLWKGSASCLQMLRNFEGALEGWLCAAALDPLDPSPWIYAAYCLYELGRLEDAQSALHTAQSLFESSTPEELLSHWEMVSQQCLSH